MGHFQNLLQTPAKNQFKHLEVLIAETEIAFPVLLGRAASESVCRPSEGKSR